MILTDWQYIVIAFCSVGVFLAGIVVIQNMRRS